jgi:hypothetical protein
VFEWLKSSRWDFLNGDRRRLVDRIAEMGRSSPDGSPARLLNSGMRNLSTWPTNEFGTSWRRATFWFDWLDEDLVEEAIEAVSPLRITPRYRFVAVVGFDTDADIVMHYLAETLPSGRRYDNENSCAVLDPCTDPEALLALVEYDMPTCRFSIFGVGVLDLADEQSYRLLLGALADRRGRFVGEMPVIEFFGSAISPSSCA